MFRRHQPYQKQTDEALLPRIASGDEAAASELYRRYAGRLNRYFLRMLGGDDAQAQAQDFTQEAFLRVIRKADAFDPAYRFETWLFTIARNLCKNEYRRRDRHPAPVPIDTQRLAQGLDPGGRIDRSAFERELQRCLEELDELPRQCFVLRFQEEMGIREISRILDCPEGTVKSRLHYTVKKLAKRLRAFNPKM